MQASITNPMYSVAVITADGVKYDITGAIIGLTLDENENQIAQTVRVSCANILHEGNYLSTTFKVADRLYVYANTGEINEEVFRGFIWDVDYTSGLTEKEIIFTCYDNLIYFNKSDICDYFTAGQTTDDICAALCEKWGIQLDYQYDTISHPKLPLSGNLGDIFLDDLLGEVKKQKGTKFVMRSIKDVITIKPVGSNSIVYSLQSANNAGPIREKTTLDDIVTRVVITGKTDDDDRTAIESTVDGNTDKYGTVQKTISKDEDTDISEAEAEAQEMIDENGEPKTTIYVNNAVDIPWLHKGDVCIVNGGSIDNKEIVITDISHNAKRKTMTVQGEYYNRTQSTSNTSNDGDYSAGKELSLNTVPLYISSDATNKATTVSGTYYLYDGIEILGRFRITNTKSRVGATPINSNVTGWIDKQYV